MPTLQRRFFDRPHLVVARELLGRELVVGECRGRVVETEGYAFEGDAACHVAFRPSARAFIGAHPPGTAYCYLNYGLHWLLNVLAADGIVLLRAVEPTAGLAIMRARRGRERAEELTSGPGRLGAAFGLDASFHGRDCCGGDPAFGFASGRRIPDAAVVRGPRIGISRAVGLPWRCWIDGHCCVSRTPRRPSIDFPRPAP